jgi:hypothetical protein
VPPCALFGRNRHAMQRARRCGGDGLGNPAAFAKQPVPFGLGWARMTTWMLHMLEAVNHLISNGMVHGDLKLDQFFLEDDMSLVLGASMAPQQLHHACPRLHGNRCLPVVSACPQELLLPQPPAAGIGARVRWRLWLWRRRGLRPHLEHGDALRRGARGPRAACGHSRWGAPSARTTCRFEPPSLHIRRISYYQLNRPLRASLPPPPPPEPRRSGA